MKKVWILTLILALTACGKSPDEVKMPTNEVEMKEVQEYIAKNLEGEERELATQVIMQYAVASAFGGVSEDMTLAEAMQKVKASNEKEAAELAKKQDVIQKMKKTVEVVYINHRKISKPGLNITGYDFRVKFRNRQEKPVYGVKGKLIFADSFGKQSGEVAIEHLGMLEKGDNVYEQIQTFSLGGGYLKDGNYTSEDVTFEPEVVVFADKSSLSIAD